ncbi:relaxin receptor 2-like [Huso huso]|uniref:Relaxin receptor 2-like n=1 Tax=Huso huso TaxID=61971 RepID=A0ABR0YSW2_HUSHU
MTGVPRLVYLQVLSTVMTVQAAAGSLLVKRSTLSPACPVGHFPCGNLSMCLPQLQHCNGVQDCSNGADELNCEDLSGWSGMFRVKGIPDPQGWHQECFLTEYPRVCDCQETELECVDVNLDSVPRVSSNVTLLSLKQNHIKNLPAEVFVQFTELEKLFLQCNCIETVSSSAFVGLHRLQKLYLSQNCIQVLTAGTFKELHNLQWLILDDNPIKIIPSQLFMGLKSLFFMSMVNNSLEQLPGSGLCTDTPALNWLDFDRNLIKQLNSSIFASCGFLTVLFLRQNEISVISENTFSSLRNLIELDLSGNKLHRLPANIFQDLRSLETLNLSGNNLSHIHPSQFDSLACVRSLDLDGIDIPNIHVWMFAPMKNLTHIYFKTFQYCRLAPHVRSCKPNTDGISTVQDLLASPVLRVCVWVIGFLTCFGNLFVICMRCCIRAENQLHALGIKCLCCADCLMGVYLFFVGVFDVKYRGEYNQHAQLWMESTQCGMMGFLAMLSSEVSVMLLAYLSLEKCLAIAFPFSTMRPGRCQTLIVLHSIWVLGFVIALIPLRNQEYFGNYYGRNGVCFPLYADETEKPGAKYYSIGIFLGLNVLAFLAILLSYVTMFLSIRKSSLHLSCKTRQLRQDVAMAHHFFFIVFTDALCWIPIIILKVLSLLQVQIPGTVTSWVAIFILPINSALNPILYTLTTSFFRERVKTSLSRAQRRNTENLSKNSSAMKLTFLRIGGAQI